MSDWLTISQYADAYAVSRPTVYKWLEAGLLTFFQVHRTIRVRNIPPVNPRQSRQAASTPLTLSLSK